MTIQLSLTVTDNQLFARYRDTLLAAPTPMADLPRIAAQSNPFRYTPYELGLTLYHALGGPTLTALLDRDADNALHLITDEASAAMPWEYAATPDRTFLACTYVFLRLLPSARPAAPAKAGLLNLVALAADPLVDENSQPRTGYKLAIDNELAAMATRLQASANAVIARRIPPTREHLQRALRQGPAILHLSCHGNVIATEAGKLAILLLEDEQGKASPLRSDHLLRIPPPGVLRLAVLSACRSAASAMDANLARALVLSGVPAAVGMQGDFPDAQSEDLAATLYEFLLAGHGLGEALRQARVAMIDHAYAVGLPVGYLAPGGDAALPLQLGPAQVAALRSPNPINLPTALLPPYFLGREGDLHALATTFTATQRVVTVVGTGGIGKTALSGAFARRFGWRWPGGVIGVTLTDLPTLSPESFVNQLLRRLLGDAAATGLADQPAEIQAETLIAAAQERQPLLLIDNYESVLEALTEGDASAPGAAVAGTLGDPRRATAAPQAPSVDLRTILAQLYPDETSIRRLVADAGLDLTQLALNTTPLNNWQAVLTAATHNNRTVALLAAVASEYPTNASLHAAWARYRAANPAADPTTLADLVANAVRLHRVVASLANSGLCLLLTSRRQPAGLAGEVVFPPPGALAGLSTMTGADLFFHHSTRAKRDRTAHNALAHQVAAVTEGHPLAIALLAGEFDTSTEVTAQGFLADWPAELAAAQRPSQAAHHVRYAVAFERSLRHLSPAAQQRLIALSRFPAPFLVEGAAYLWRSAEPVAADVAPAEPVAAELVEADAELVEARRHLDDFVRRSLLRVDGTFSDSDRTATWRLEPVIAHTLQARLSTADSRALEPGYLAYGQWLVNRVYGETGRDIGLAQLTQQWLDALTSQADQQPVARKARYCWLLAVLLRQFGRMNESTAVLEIGEQTALAQNDIVRLSRILQAKAELKIVAGDLDEAIALLYRCIELNTQPENEGEKSVNQHTLANVYVRRGELDRALDLYQQSLAIQDQLGDIQGRSATLHEMANVYVTRGELDRALDLYQQSLAIQDQLGDIQGRSATLHEMANVYVRRGELDRALDLYQQSLAIQDQLGDIQGRSATLHAMANVYVTRGELDRALDLYQQSLAIQDQLGDIQGRSATLHAMANVYVRRGELDRALDLYQQSLAIDGQLGDIQGRSATLHEMANVYVRRGELDRALDLYQQSLAIKDQLGDIQGRSATIHQMANVYVRRGELDRALDLYQQSLAIQDQLGDIQGRSATLHAMANVYVTRGELDHALDLYQQSLAIQDQLGDIQGRSATIHQMANVYVRRGELDRALDLYQQSLAIKDQLGDIQGRSATLSNMSNLFMARGEWAEAERFLTEAFVIARKLGDLYWMGMNVTKLGQVANQKGDLATARQRYQAGIDLFAQLGMPEANQVRQMLAALEDGGPGRAATLEEKMAALRQQPPDRQTEQQLSILLYNQAMQLAKAGRLEEAIVALEEVVQIDERWGLDDLATDQAALAELRRRQAGTPAGEAEGETVAAAAPNDVSAVLAALQAQVAQLPLAEQAAMRAAIEQLASASPAEQRALLQAGQQQQIDALADQAVEIALAAITNNTQDEAAHNLTAAATTYAEDEAVGSPYWQLAQLLTALAALLQGATPGPVAAVHAGRLARVGAEIGD